MTNSLLLLMAIALALAVACSASEPPEEIVDQIEGVFTEASAPPSDLAMYRGGPARTGVYHTTGVLEEPEVKWTFRADRKIATSAAISGNTIMFGADNATFYALDLQTGEELWTVEAGRQIRSSPLVSDGVVYFGAGDRTLRAVNVENGQELWRFEATAEFNSSPSIVKGTIYATSRLDFIYALDARTGLLKWERNLNECCAMLLGNSAPTIIGELVSSIITGGRLGTVFQAIDRTSGDIRWSIELTGGPSDAVAVSSGVAFRAVSKPNVDGKVRAIALETQDVRWTFETDDRARVLTSPAVTDELVIFGDSKGRLQAIDVETGEVEWFFDTGVEVGTAPSVADGLVYFGTIDGAIFAVDLITGHERWRYQTDLGRVRPSPCRSGVLANCVSKAPVVHDGVLYVGNAAGTFYALE